MHSRQENAIRTEIFNPHPLQFRKFSYKEMLECWKCAKKDAETNSRSENEDNEFLSWIEKRYKT